MKSLYFIRHGLSVTNELGLYSGQTETPLTDLGREQAKEAAEKIKKLKIDAIASSPLERALETAQIIADKISYPKAKIYVNELLTERRLGALEGQPYEPGKTDYDEVEGIEITSDLLERAKKALEWLESTGADVILIVSHGAIGRAIRHNIPGSTKFDEAHKFMNGQLVKLI